MIQVARVVSLLLTMALLASSASAQEETWSTSVAKLEKCGENLGKCRAFVDVEKGVAENAKRLDELAKGTLLAQRAALRIMASQGARKEALQLLVESTDEGVRLEAVGLAANTGQRALAPTIMVMALKARDEKNEQVLLKALFALGRLSHPDATPLLMELIHDPVQKIARAAIEALGRVGGNNEVVAAVGKQAHDTNLPVGRRLVAIQGLGYFQDPSAVDILVEFSRNEDVSFRRAAIESLGRTKDRRAVPQLVERLKDKEVHPQLIVALASIADEKAAAMLHSLSIDDGLSAETRFDALCAAGKAGSKRSLPALVNALDSRKEDERMRAAEALAYLGDSGALEPLARRFKKSTGKERTMLLWAVKRCSGESLVTEEQIDEFLKKKEK